MSVAEYLENIKGKLQRLPQITRQQRKGSKKLGEDARRMYAKLVQAFGWSAGVFVSRPRVKLTGLTSGQKRWMRVRAINDQGPGSWSDPSCRMIP